MRSSGFLSVATACALAFGGVSVAQAAVMDGMAPAPTPTTAAKKAVESVRVAQRVRGRRGIGPGGAAAIIGGAIITGIIINEAAKAERRRGYRPEKFRYGDADLQACADQYVSFRYSDGTYQPYGGGGRVLCPYLR